MEEKEDLPNFSGLRLNDRPTVKIIESPIAQCGSQLEIPAFCFQESVSRLLSVFDSFDLCFKNFFLSADRQNHRYMLCNILSHLVGGTLKGQRKSWALEVLANLNSLLH